MELYKITTANMVHENLSWDRVCDVLSLSEDGNAWKAHEGLEDRAEYRFLTVYGDENILERM